MPPLPIELDTFVANSAKVFRDPARGVRLRPVDAAGLYDPSRDYQAEHCDFAAVVGTGIRSLWGFEAEHDASGDPKDAEPDGGTIRFRLSEDGGVTWRHWNAGWVAAVDPANDWATIAQVRANIATFPLGKGATRSIKVRMRLDPDSTKRRTPVVRAVWLLAEFDHDAVVDAMRSVHAWLAGVAIPSYCQEDSDGTNKVTLSDFGMSVAPAKGIRVHDVTNDPGRGTDLFQAYDAGTRVVTMTGAQAAGRTLEIRYEAAVPVHMTSEAFTHLSQLPIYELRVDASADDEQSGGYVTESNPATLIARVRTGPRYVRCLCTVIAVDKDQERAHEMAGAVRRAAEEQGFVRSLATGGKLRIGDVEPLQPRVDLDAGVFSPQTAIELWTRDDARTYTQHGLATEIRVRTTGEDLRNIRITPADPESVWHDGVTKVVP